MSLLPDLAPLLRVITKFTARQEQIITLLEENNQLQKLILIQLGGKPTEKLNLTLKEENNLNPTLNSTLK